MFARYFPERYWAPQALTLCMALVLFAEIAKSAPGDSQQPLDWLLGQPYFRDLASSLPDGAELISEGAAPDDKVPGFFKAEVRAFISENAAGTTHIGMFRFSPSDGIIKKEDPDTGYYIDVDKAASESDPVPTASQLMGLLTAVALGPPAAPASTPAPRRDDTPATRPAATPVAKAQPLYGVRMDGSNLACFNLESGSTVTKVRAPSGVLVGGPSFSGDRAVVTMQKGNVRTTYIYKMPSMSTVTRTTDVQ